MAHLVDVCPRCSITYQPDAPRCAACGWIGEAPARVPSHHAIAAEHRAAMVGSGCSCSPIEIGPDGSASFTVEPMRYMTRHRRTFDASEALTVVRL